MNVKCYIRVILILCTLILSLHLWGFARAAGVVERKDTKDVRKVIAVIGSSIAAGWVTSFQHQYDMQNGYAYRLGRFLEPQGYIVKNVSVPGDDTKKVLQRLEKDLFPLAPEFVLIGLSLSNEGIMEQQPEAVMEQFFAGITGIVRQCRARGIIPILGSCYAYNDYNLEHYRLTKAMNMKLNSLDLPLIDFLGALEDGSGHFPAGVTYDWGHPDNRGHEEFFYAIVPGKFAALQKGVKEPVFLKEDGFVRVKQNLGTPALSYVPHHETHSFSFCFKFRTKYNGRIAEVGIGNGNGKMNGNCVLLIDNSQVEYRSPSGISIKAAKPAATGEWHTAALIHRYMNRETLLFIDGEWVGSEKEQLLPRYFSLGVKNSPKGVDYKDLLIYRAALNSDEVQFLEKGNLWRGSLEVYAPLNEPIRENKEIRNLACSSSVVMAYPPAQDMEEEISQLEEKIKQSEQQRKNEKVFPERQAIDMAPQELLTYAGEYEVKPGDVMKIIVEEQRIFIVDKGMKIEIYPESKNLFFVKNPQAKVSVIFERKESGEPQVLKLSVNDKLILSAEKKK